MRSCREIIKIVDQVNDLTWSQRFEVRFHLIICRRCARFAKHLKIIGSSFRKMLDHQMTDQVGDIKLIEQRIILRLKKN